MAPHTHIQVLLCDNSKRMSTMCSNCTACSPRCLPCSPNTIHEKALKHCTGPWYGQS